MKEIGIFANYLNEKHITQIENTVKGSGYTIRYYKDLDDVKANVHTAEIIYGYYPAPILKLADSLKWFATASAGVDPFLSDDVYPHESVILTNSNGSYGTTISEHMIMVLLMMMRKQPGYMKVVEAHEWRQLGAVRSIHGSKICVLGTGDIGTTFAKKVKALGAAKVVGVRRDLSKPADPCYDEMYSFKDVKTAVQDMDVIAMAMPATKETIGLVSADVLAAMNKNTLIVNVGRGNAIDQEALVKALENEEIAGAALDVVVPEPLPADSVIYETKNLLLTPHVSGNMSLGYTCDLNVDAFCDNLVRYFKGEKLEHLVDRTIGY